MSLDAPPGQRLGLGVGLMLTAGAVAAVQAHRNGSPTVSLALTLAPALGIVGGLALGGPRAADLLVPAVLLGTFLGATGYLLGQQFGDRESERAVTVTMAALLVGSALLFALWLPLL